MAKGAMEGTFEKSVLSLLRPRAVSGLVIDDDIVIYEDNQGTKALAENRLRPGSSTRIDVRWPSIRDLVR